jgi:hypothetical protein
LSNIAANSEQDAESLIDAQIFMHMILCCHDMNYELRKEAIWTISNICYKVSDAGKMAKIKEFEVLQALLGIFQKDFEQGSMMILALEACKRLLEKLPEIAALME